MKCVGQYQKLLAAGWNGLGQHLTDLGCRQKGGRLGRWVNSILWAAGRFLFTRPREEALEFGPRKVASWIGLCWTGFAVSRPRRAGPREECSCGGPLLESGIVGARLLIRWAAWRVFLRWAVDKVWGNWSQSGGLLDFSAGLVGCWIF